MLEANFWQQKSLDALTKDEWEALCDGCAKCCLHKLEDEDSGEVLYTKISCRFMTDDCRCEIYQDRHQQVPECVWLKPEDVEHFHWLPQTCAYRLVAEGKPLPDWHHLVCGDRNAVHRAGVSIQGRSLNESYVHPDGWEEHIIHWVE